MPLGNPLGYLLPDPNQLPPMAQFATMAGGPGGGVPGMITPPPAPLNVGRGGGPFQPTGFGGAVNPFNVGGGRRPPLPPVVTGGGGGGIGQFFPNTPGGPATFNPAGQGGLAARQGAPLQGMTAEQIGTLSGPLLDQLSNQYLQNRWNAIEAFNPGGVFQGGQDAANAAIAAQGGVPTLDPQQQAALFERQRALSPWDPNLWSPQARQAEMRRRVSSALQGGGFGALGQAEQQFANQVGLNPAAYGIPVQSPFARANLVNSLFGGAPQGVITPTGGTRQASLLQRQNAFTNPFLNARAQPRPATRTRVSGRSRPRR